MALALAPATVCAQWRPIPPFLPNHSPDPPPVSGTLVDTKRVAPQPEHTGTWGPTKLLQPIPAPFAMDSTPNPCPRPFHMCPGLLCSAHTPMRPQGPRPQHPPVIIDMQEPQQAVPGRGCSHSPAAVRGSPRPTPPGAYTHANSNPDAHTRCHFNQKLPRRRPTRPPPLHPPPMSEA